MAMTVASSFLVHRLKDLEREERIETEQKADAVCRLSLVPKTLNRGKIASFVVAATIGR